MHISRREFLGSATGAVVSLASIARGDERGGTGVVLTTRFRSERFGCVLLDLEDCCALRESLAGFEAAMAGTGVRFVRSAPTPASGRSSALLRQASIVIVPGCARIEPDVAARLAGRLEEGILLVLESGAAFTEPTDFEAHRSMLGRHFGLAVEAPIDLWLSTSAGVTKRAPYVDFVWPVPVKVRDFSRVVPLARHTAAAQARPTSEVIGWVDGWPIAARRRVGRGTLVYLGSPLGPALCSGDREAQAWFAALLGGA